MSAPTPEEFAEEARAFLDAHARPCDPASFKDEREAELSEPDEEVRLEACRAWRALRFDNDLGWITGPPEYGGRELSTRYDSLYRELESQYDVPADVLAPALDIIGSALAAHGSEAAKDRYLRALFRGDLTACQLFSEPDAGSDLAAVQTRAVRDGDGWRITGQKVWTTDAHNRDVGEAVCRTDAERPKHEGITIFLVDLRASGVEVRPLRDMTGRAHFNEVFLADVYVPDENRLGDVNDGWRVLRTSLMHERAVVAGRNVDQSGGWLGAFSPLQLARTMRRLGLLDDTGLRQRLADLVVRYEVARYATQQTKERLGRGELPGADLALTKITYSHNRQLLSELAADVLGPRVIADSGDPVANAWSTALLNAPAMRLAGGTDEVLLNVVAERVLGLPRDPAIDNSIPFNRLPRSGGRR